ncbi:hypothetical protein QUB70_00825 [Microcoleus sp. A003_D6]|uniref:hypothetical protein n=1 Tax=Microcoleus sp. A003_D6 TaxID=3055266 RepID=UPI002FCF4CB5
MSIADTGKKNHQIFFPSHAGTYVFARIKETLGIPEPLSSYPTNRQFRYAAAYIEARSRQLPGFIVILVELPAAKLIFF